MHFADSATDIARVQPQVEALRVVVATDPGLGASCSALTLAAGTRRGGSLATVTLDDTGRVPPRLRDRYVRADANRAVVTGPACSTPLDFIGGHGNLQTCWGLAPRYCLGQKEADDAPRVVAQLDRLSGLTEPATGFGIKRVSNHRSLLATPR